MSDVNLVEKFDAVKLTVSFDSVDNEAETGIQPRCGYAATV
jgi:hypothetical protein